jgi:cell division protein FtsW
MRTPGRPDYAFLGLLALIVAFGFVVLTSATGPFAFQKFADGWWFVRHQALYGLLPGLLLFLVCSRLNYHVWQKYALHLLVLTLGLLVLVFIPGLAAPWGTSRSWISVAGFSFQPAELAKLTFVAYLAARFASRDASAAASAREGLVPFMAALGAVGVLMLLQPDLGTFLVISAASFAVYFVAGASWLHVGAIAATGVGLVAAMVAAAPYRLARFTSFLHPEADPLGAGYHVSQAFLAIGSGGLLGVGLGHSRQKYLYLPEVAGDSIFAVAAEELGFVVMLLFLLAFGAFVWRGMRIARRAPDAFGRLLVSGIMAWIFFQALFNIGSMVGLFPLTGVPLPFVSYGGTAMLVALAAMGVVTSVARQSETR